MVEIIQKWKMLSLTTDKLSLSMFLNTILSPKANSEIPELMLAVIYEIPKDWFDWLILFLFVFYQEIPWDTVIMKYYFLS